MPRPYKGPCLRAAVPRAAEVSAARPCDAFPARPSSPGPPWCIDTSRRAKRLGNHLFLSCGLSAWGADWQAEGEGPEAVLIVWGPCSNMDGERGSPRRQGKNGNLCEARHSKCHLCEDLDLLGSGFNNLGCSGLFLFPLAPKAPLPPLFLLHQQALFQWGSNPLSVA